MNVIKLIQTNRSVFTDCMENILNTVLLTGTSITDKNTQVFYTWPKHATESSVL